MPPTSAPLKRLLERLDTDIVLPLDDEELAELLRVADEEQEVRTSLAGPIRLLRLGDRRLFQEQTTEGTPLLRLLRVEGEAQELLKDRLDTYERMWDG